MPRLLGFALAVFLSGAAASAQQNIEISEPRTVTIAELYKQADVVAVVKVLSGDSEGYDVTVYKAKVLTAFKGVAAGEQLFFGPLVGYEVGGEYVAFLRRAKVDPKPQRQGGIAIGYGQFDVFYLIMYQGYSMMPLRYECVFDGKVPDQSCDYGVRVNTDQVKLPPVTKTFPQTSKDDFTDANRWVRKDVFLRLVDSLKK